MNPENKQDATGLVKKTQRKGSGSYRSKRGREGSALFMFRTPVSQDEKSYSSAWWCCLHTILKLVDTTELNENINDNQSLVANMDGREGAFHSLFGMNFEWTRHLGTLHLRRVWN